MRRKICVITGTRADYGILVPVMKAIRSSRSLKLYVVATYMHLMKEFGYTLKEIKKDGFKICAKLNIANKKDTVDSVAFSVGKAVSSFTRIFKKIKPDLIVVLGDRGEMLAAAISANYMNIPVAHIHGGEISGHVDGVVRHAITKLSHIHFASTKKAKWRILGLGEESWRVFAVGAPSLDRIFKDRLPSRNEILTKYSLAKDESFALLVHHPDSSECNEPTASIKNILQVLSELRMQTIVIFPNADAGGRRMIKEIKKFEKYPFIKAFKSVGHMNYLGLLKFSSILIGNSSSGIIEAPSFKRPVVNIGKRQKGRERSVNVIDVPNKKKAIRKAILMALNNRKFQRRLKKCKNRYGDGKAAKRIVKVLSRIKLDQNLVDKRITF